MIGTNLILQEEYSDHYLIPQTNFLRDNTVDDIESLTDLELLVTDSETDRPISKAMISIDKLGCTAVCDSQGKVIINKILSGRFILDVIVQGYSASSVLVHLSAVNSNRLKVKMVRNC